MIMNIEIASRLAAKRKKAGLSQEGLAEALGVSRQTVSKWERSESSPDTDNLIALAKLYGASLDELLYIDDAIEDDVAFEASNKSGKRDDATVDASESTFTVRKNFPEDQHGAVRSIEYSVLLDGCDDSDVVLEQVENGVVVRSPDNEIVAIIDWDDGSTVSAAEGREEERFDWKALLLGLDGDNSPIDIQARLASAMKP
jgi:HTH-type transcriptional regulator/antitoxin HipB